jgi:6-phosphogluconolactonase
VGEVRDFARLDEWTDALCELVVQASGRREGDLKVALCGGRSPGPLYRRLSGEKGLTQGWRVFFTDERCVPPEDSLSNYGMIKSLFLDPGMISPEGVFRIRGEAGPDQAADEYQELLEREAPDGFDLIILGLGSDGHIASLFPMSPLLNERTRLALPVLDAPDLPRVTITPGMILRSGMVILLVRGEEKRDAFRRFMGKKESEVDLPAMLLQKHGDLHVMVLF